MKYLTQLLALLLATPALCFVVLPPSHQQQVFNLASTPDDDNELRLIALSPSETRWVTEAQKLELKREGRTFMDITDHQDLPTLLLTSNSGRPHTNPFVPPPLPAAPQFQDIIQPILRNLTTSHMESNLNHLTGFHTRYYKSEYGRKSSDFVHDLIGITAPGITVSRFSHPWPQSSLIATIPGRTNKTVIIAAHQDSINLFLPSLLGAPGADDDGSGTVTVLEALRVIWESEFLSSSHMTFENTLEFHFYSAEEGGLLGSQAVFSAYAKEGREVVAMLQQDMTGFIQRTLDAGEKESIAVVTDFVDPELTAFVKKVVDEYCGIGWVETKCGYACSDHASASTAGYKSAFVIEAKFELTNQQVHTTEDVPKKLSFNHMKEFAKVAVGVAMELAMAKFE